jgi:oxygen-dependent protoporphyrinogen oxidase
MNSVAIIGGGITGLTAAFRLQQAGLEVTVYEASPRVGGPIQSYSRDGFLAEFGPNSVLETSPLISRLVQDLGVESRKILSLPAAEKRYTVRRRKLTALPGTPGSFLTSSLFSVAAKCRLAIEPFISANRSEEDESVANFVRRRLGQEFLDYAINPFVGGIYAGNPEHLSVRHAFPKLHALEQRYGSLIVGQYLGARERKRTGEVSKQEANKFSFDAGLQVLTDTLGKKLAGSIQLSTPVTALDRTESGWNVEVCLPNGGGLSVRAHSAIVLAAPAHGLARIRLNGDSVKGLKPLGEIPYPPVVSIVLGFRREEVAHPLDGFGMLVPEVEGFGILGTLFSSTLFPGRAPAGHVTLTTYVGGSRSPELTQKSGEALREAVLQDLFELLGVTGKPVFEHQAMFPLAIPQYNVGHGRIREHMDRLESESPGLFLAGQVRDGISLSDSILSGHRACDRVQHFLAEASKTTAATKQILTTV